MPLNIIFKDSRKLTRFDEVEEGDIFINSNNKAYIKTRIYELSADDQNSNHHSCTINCICLNNGRRGHYADSTEVRIAKDAELQLNLMPY